MRIALSSIHPRPLSGQIEGLVGLAQAMQARGHQVTVVSAFPSEALLSLDRLHLSSRHRFLIHEPFRIVDILTDLVRLSPRVDVIQLDLPTPAFSIFADLVQSLVRVPVVIYYEAHLVSRKDLFRRDLLRAASDFYLPRFLVNNGLIARMTAHLAARYVVSSQYQKSELATLGYKSDQISLLPNLIPRDKLTRPTRESARAALGFPSSRVITYFGHYHHVKGVDVLLRAFRLIAPQFPDASLALAWSGLGTDREIETLLRLPELNGRVIPLGQVNVPQLLAASDVVALPYRLTIGQAAYPGALLEALLANVPTVTTDLPLLRELTAGGQTALLAPPDDPPALASAVARLLQDPARVEQMKKAQEEWARKTHPENVISDYERLYEAVSTRKTAVLLSAGSGK